MKIWDKGYDINTLIERFTVGNDRELDLLLAQYDILGTIAHVKMLKSVQLISEDEETMLLKELKDIYSLALHGDFIIEDKTEDVHSQVEFMLIKKIGSSGKKVHTGRSRNDQVMLDMKLFTRSKIQQLVNLTLEFFNRLISLSEEHKSKMMPGYTHFQLAMPSSFGLWFGAFAESLTDDIQLLLSAYKIVNQNPLGSAAGYGSSFPLNRQMTTDLLGFEKSLLSEIDNVENGLKSMLKR